MHSLCKLVCVKIYFAEKSIKKKVNSCTARELLAFISCTNNLDNFLLETEHPDCIIYLMQSEIKMRLSH